MKKGNLNIYVTMVSLCVAVVACSTQTANDLTPNGGENKLPVDVRVVKTSAVVQQETVAGSILPNREITIMSELARKIVAISFEGGNIVHKGQLLYKLDDAEIIARLKQTEAELSLAKLNERRLLELLRNESVRQEEYDVARTKLQILLAAEELLQVELEKTSIRAPFSGVIGITKVETGALISPGIPLVKLQDQGQVKVQFSVPEKYIPYVKNGSPISFSTAVEQIHQTAFVVAIESGVDELSRSITVQALADNKSGKLKPGMSATVSFSSIDADEMGISVPTESLIPSAQGYSVFKVKDGAAKITPVSIGVRNEVEALITSGLMDGDTILVSNILRASDGRPVQVVTAN